MRIAKKILSFYAAVITAMFFLRGTAIAVLTANASEGNIVTGTYGNLTYSISSGEVTIINCDKNATYEVMPDKLDGLPVTKIGNAAFKDCTKLTGIVISDSVKNVGLNAFENCTELIEVTIPDSVINISGYMFSRCTALKSLELPKTTASIGYNAFEGCTNLKDIKLPESVQTIGASAFENCKSLLNMDIPDAVLSIGDRAFQNASSLTFVKLGNSLKVLGGLAFADCTSLKSINITASVNLIGDGIFRNSMAMTSLKVDSGNKSFSDFENVLFNYDKTELISYPAGKANYSYTVPKTVTKIHSYAFYGNMHLTEITLSDALQSIDEYAFCSDSGVTSISKVYYAYENCNSAGNLLSTDINFYSELDKLCDLYQKASNLECFPGNGKDDKVFFYESPITHKIHCAKMSS